jgi:hypothetical protein
MLHKKKKNGRIPSGGLAVIRENTRGTGGRTHARTQNGNKKSRSRSGTNNN